MTREEILEYFKDINFVYNDCTRLDTLKRMLCELEQEQKTGQWIPVISGKLPKGYERVLVTRKMFHWANEPVEYTVDMESFSGYVDFVAWMPLPTPYKAESMEVSE